MDWHGLLAKCRHAGFLGAITGLIAGLIILATTSRERQLEIAHGWLIIIWLLLALTPIMVFLAWWGWRRPKK